MGGRNTPSAGLEKTAQYLADSYRTWGLLPAGENSGWFQRYPLSAGQTSAPNVVAMVRGIDPVLRDEYVIFSGHMDHLGTVGDGVGGCSAFTRTDATVDRICNGADDNGSGTVALLSIAEAVTKLNGRTRRSIVVLNVSGEEKGLLGSAYYADHPTVPLSNVVADINLDMISHNSPDSIVVIGKDSSDMGATLARVQVTHPELHLIAADDIWPSQHFYNRSDHYNFARKGVPILFFFAGTHPQYHRADDEVALVNTSKLVSVTQLAFYLGIEIANTVARPQPIHLSRQAIMAGQSHLPER
jgi:Zn-dependent M28 family amino/carboxypeptidase